MPTDHSASPTNVKEMLNRSGSAPHPPPQFPNDLAQHPKPDQVSAEEDEEEEEELEEDETNLPPAQAQDDEESGFDDQILNSLIPPEDDATESALNRSGEMAPADNGPVYDSDSSASGTDSLTWISWFCSLAGHEYFAEVAEDFIEDDFNLTGLVAMVPFYKEALEMILDVEADDTVKVPDVSIVESSAELLYGLIHQRYIVTRQGLAQMNAKYENAHFGYCPRVFCQTSKVVPCGKSDLPGDDTVVLYCPNCLDIYHPPSSRFNGIDGAFFGTTFPHLLFQTYREIPPILLPSSTSSSQPSSDPPCDLQSKSSIMSHSSAEPAPSSKIYGPRIYGFRVSERSRSGPRMQWLRLRPRDDEELHRGLLYHERDTSQPPEQT